MSGLFYVFRCTGCGRWGVKEQRVHITKGSFTCKYCRKSITIKPKTIYGLGMIHKGPFENPRDATIMCQSMNEKRGKPNVN